MHLSEVLRGSFWQKPWKEGDKDNFQDRAQRNSQGKYHSDEILLQPQRISNGKADHYINAQG